MQGPHYRVASERRFCDQWMTRTVHDMLEGPDAIYTYKRRRVYQYQECGHRNFKRGLRPSAESVY